MKVSDEKYLLYGVTGRDFHPGKSLERAVAEAIRGGVTMIQLREKFFATGATAALGARLLPLCRRCQVPLLINDDVEAALLCDADGVHVGQSDMELARARKILGEGKIIGVSAQTVAQAVAAWRGGADYLGVGAVFPTGTKHDADAVSWETLAAITAAVPIPVVAIGGIGLKNVEKLRSTGIAGISVISALFGASDTEIAARELRAAAKKTVRK